MDRRFLKGWRLAVRPQFTSQVRRHRGNTSSTAAVRPQSSSQVDAPSQQKRPAVPFFQLLSPTGTPSQQPYIPHQQPGVSSTGTSRQRLGVSSTGTSHQRLGVSSTGTPSQQPVVTSGIPRQQTVADAFMPYGAILDLQNVVYTL